MSKSTQVLVKLEPAEEAEQAVKAIAEVSSEHPDLTVDVLRMRNIDGVSETQLLLAIGSSGIVAAVAKILVSWINARANRTVRISDTEIQGYSIEQVCHLLRSTSERKADKIDTTKAPKD